jgi:NADH dehydrogenase
VAVRRPHLANFLQPFGDVGQIQVVQANVRVEETVKAALRGADVVINLVGLLAQTRRQKFEAVHTQGAATVARLAKEVGVKHLVQFSAIGADATSPAKYAKTKAAGEAAVRAAFPNAVILRPSVVFGPEDDFFNRFAALANITPVMPLVGGGKTKFQPVYVGDVAKAAVAALELKSAAGRTFELGGPEVYTMREIIEFILEATYRTRVLASLPFWVAKIQGAFLGLLPKPMLTVDQVKLLRSDNVVGLTGDETIGTIADLGVDRPVTVAAEVPSYLARFRKQGQFAKASAG